MNDLQRNLIYQYRMQGFGYKKTAKKVGLTVDSVKSFCKKNNLNGYGEIVKLNANILKEKTLVCECCGRDFKLNYQGRPRRFCSDKCRRTWWRKNPNKLNKNTFYKFTCPECNKEFISYGNKNRKFCSKQCFVKSRFYKEESVNECS